MKKLMTIAAAALCASVFADGITSANIVGYQSQAATKDNYYLRGLQFNGVAGSFKISDITGDFSGPAWDVDNSWYDTAPQIMVRNADGGYDFYYFLSDGLDNGDGTYSPAWVDDAASPAEATVALGTGFWIYDPYNANSSFTVSGEVCSDASVTKDFAADFNLAANPYPVTCAFGDIVWDGMVGVEWDVDNTWYDTAPQIMVRNADGGYDFYYFLSDGLENGDGTYSPAWVDDAAAPVEASLIEAGAAFWYKPTTAVTATFSL